METVRDAGFEMNYRELSDFGALFALHHPNGAVQHQRRQGDYR
jgi:hypothetical protein